MAEEMVEKIMNYSDLFTEPDKNGRILTKVEIHTIGDGENIRSKTFAQNAPTDELLFRGLTVNELKGKKIRVFIQGAKQTLGDIVTD